MRMQLRAAVLVGALCLTGLAAMATGAQANVFVFACDYDHSFKDDPIVHPLQLSVLPTSPDPAGQAPVHIHSFGGNTTTNAASTEDSLLAGSTNCRIANGADKSAYWFPSMFVVGSDMALHEVTADVGRPIYYKGNSRTVAFPQGLRFIAGNHAASTPQSTDVLSWSCINGTLTDGVTAPSCAPSSSAPTTVRMSINFPDCWDGTPPTGLNDTSHMSFRTGSNCPSGTIRVPGLNIFVHYDTPGGPDASLALGTGAKPAPGSVMLSSACDRCYDGEPIAGIPASDVNPGAGWYSGHGDFFMAWSPATDSNGETALQRLVRLCLNVDCTTDMAASCVPGSVPESAPNVCTATVTGRNWINPTGQVTFTTAAAGTFAPSSCTLVADPTDSNVSRCAVTYTPAPPPLGTTRQDLITATYGGDDTHLQNIPGTTGVTVGALP